MTETSKTSIGRRTALIGAATAAIAAPFVRPARAADRTLTVSTYGGFFEDSFKGHIHPEFTKATGIAVVSQPQAEGAQFLIQLAQANKAGNAPMDLCMNSDEDVLRGRAQGIWKSFDTAKIKNIGNVLPGLVFNGPKGVDGVAGLAWYLTLVVNPDEVKPLPDSWTALWAPSKKIWGLSGGGTSNLFEVAAHVYFGGIGILDTHEGIDKVAARRTCRTGSRFPGNHDRPRPRRHAARHRQLRRPAGGAFSRLVGGDRRTRPTGERLG